MSRLAISTPQLSLSLHQANNTKYHRERSRNDHILGSNTSSGFTSPNAFRSVLVPRPSRDQFSSKEQHLGGRCQQLRVKSFSRNGLMTPKYGGRGFEATKSVIIQTTPYQRNGSPSQMQSEFMKSRATTASLAKSTLV